MLFSPERPVVASSRRGPGSAPGVLLRPVLRELAPVQVVLGGLIPLASGSSGRGAFASIASGMEKPGVGLKGYQPTPGK